VEELWVLFSFFFFRELVFFDAIQRRKELAEALLWLKQNQYPGGMPVVPQNSKTLVGLFESYLEVFKRTGRPLKEVYVLLGILCQKSLDIEKNAQKLKDLFVLRTFLVGGIALAVRWGFLLNLDRQTTFGELFLWGAVCLFFGGAVFLERILPKNWWFHGAQLTGEGARWMDRLFERNTQGPGGGVYLEFYDQLLRAEKKTGHPSYGDRRDVLERWMESQDDQGKAFLEKAQVFYTVFEIVYFMGLGFLILWHPIRGFFGIT
jgi:hypothetical protein